MWVLLMCFFTPFTWEISLEILARFSLCFPRIIYVYAQVDTKLCFLLPCDQKSLHYSNYFPGINFGITLHSLYRKYLSVEIIWFYFTFF